MLLSKRSVAHPKHLPAQPIPADHPANTQVRFVIDLEQKLVVVKFGKTVTAADITGYVSRLLDHPSFDPDFAEIADLTEIEEMNLSAAEFLKLADEVDPFSHRARRAFVVRTATQAHAARMHKILRTQRNFEIFNSVEDAERWIKG